MQANKLPNDTKVATRRLSGSLLVLPSPSRYAQRNEHADQDYSWQFDELMHDSHLSSNTIQRRRRWQFLLLGALAVGVSLLSFYLVWNAHIGNPGGQFKFINEYLTKRTTSGDSARTPRQREFVTGIVACGLTLTTKFHFRHPLHCLCLYWGGGVGIQPNLAISVLWKYVSITISISTFGS